MSLIDFLILTAILTYYKYTNTLDEVTSNQCSTMFNEYTPKRTWASWTMMVFLGRRVLSILVLVMGYKHPGFQIGAFFFINAAVCYILFPF